MKQITGEEFKKEVVDFKGVVLADFYADWCGPCRMLSPLIEEMDKENKSDEIKFVKVNVDEEQELAGMFSVMSIPTVLIFKDGKLAAQKVGLDSKESYLDAVKKIKVS